MTEGGEEEDGEQRMLSSLHDFEREAMRKKKKKEERTFNPFKAGPDDALTLKGNEEEFKKIQLLSPVLKDVSGLSIHTTLLGRDVDFPLIVAPWIVDEFADPQSAELSTAVASYRENVPFCLTTLSSRSFDQIASHLDQIHSEVLEDGFGSSIEIVDEMRDMKKAPDQGMRRREGEKDLWFQLDVLQDKEQSLRLIKRAEEFGFRVIVVTADVSLREKEDRDRRNGFQHRKSLQFIDFRC